MLLAHHNCSKCKAHRDPCIYKVFGPCKWLQTGEDNITTSRSNEQKNEQKHRGATALQANILREDDQLSPAVNLQPDGQQQKPHHYNLFPEL